MGLFSGGKNPNEGLRMMSEGIWLATRDETGQLCWVNNVTRQRASRVGDTYETISPVRTPIAGPQQGMPYTLRSPSTALGTQYMYQGGGYQGALPPLELLWKRRNGDHSLPKWLDQLVLAAA